MAENVGVLPGAGPGGAPVIVINQNARREEGRKAQLANIQAAKAVADIIRTCLGPRAMLKMLLDPMGGIVMTNDGNAILREIDVSHPAAKSMIDLSRALDEEVGDGTTSVIIVASEFLSAATQYLERNIHPTIIVSAYLKLLKDAQTIGEELCYKLDLENETKVLNVIQSCVGTKFVSKWSEVICKLALKAVRTVTIERADETKEIDIKRYAKVEKIPGGEVEDCEVLDGVMFNKDVLTNLKRVVENPVVLLLDQGIEYKKMESQANIEIGGEHDMTKILEQEENFIKLYCEKIKELGATVVVTEKGLSDLAQYFLAKFDITAIRRLRKTDNLRIARACNATIVHDINDAKPEDLGRDCGLFEVKKIGDEYFTFFLKCKNPKACSILLRGGSKDVLNEVERNLMDAMNVARNIWHDPRLIPGGGAFEMAISEALIKKSKQVKGLEQMPYQAGAKALDIIARTLAKNCGTNVVRLMTDLRAKHAAGKDNLENASWGVDGITGKLTDIAALGIWDSYAVRIQVLKTAVEASCVILRIDDVVSGIKRKQEGGGGGQPQGQPSAEQMEMAAEQGM